MARQPVLRLFERSELEHLATCPKCQAALPRRRRQEIWVEVPLEGGWVAAYRMVVRARSPLVAEVRLFPEGSGPRHPGRWSEQAGDVPAGGVPGRALRALRLKDPIELFPRIVANWERRHGAGSAMKVLGRFGISKTKAIVPRRPGRAGRSDNFYAVWAASYVERVRAGSRHSAKDLAARPPFRLKGDLPDAGGASVNTVRDILQEARRRGLLTSAPRGRPGGELTEKAERILRGRPPRRAPG